MTRLGRDRIRFLALATLYDLARKAHDGAVAPEPWLRALLGLLWIETGGREEDRWLFDNFWKVVTEPFDGPKQPQDMTAYMRQRDAIASINGITHALGWEPTVSLYDAMERLLKR